MQLIYQYYVLQPDDRLKRAIASPLILLAWSMSYEDDRLMQPPNLYRERLKQPKAKTKVDSDRAVRVPCLYLRSVHDGNAY